MGRAARLSWSPGSPSGLSGGPPFRAVWPALFPAEPPVQSGLGLGWTLCPEGLARAFASLPQSIPAASLLPRESRGRALPPGGSLSLPSSACRAPRPGARGNGPWEPQPASPGRGEAAQIQASEGPRNSCPEMKFKVKEMGAELSIFAVDSHQERSTDHAPCDFSLREQYDSDIKVERYPESYYEFDEDGKSVRQYSFLIQCKKMVPGKDCSQYAKYRESSNEQLELIESHEKPPQVEAYQCTHYEMVFSPSSELIQHQKSHTRGILYISNENGKMTPKPKFTALQILHTRKEAPECNECGTTCSDHSSLTDHPQFHSAKKPSVCDQSRNPFGWDSELLKHPEICTSDDLHKCNECGMAFSYLSHLMDHQRTHNREKLYECNQCQKAFSSILSLSSKKSNNPKTMRSANLDIPTPNAYMFFF
ncbi:zinc finger protein 79-like [Gracilinanus agilis]|uniref:zinc finger protein 79-like n=1 Tax=Gracilinanus agilis TaxID=191870 RepID=UPI001CFDC39C|nr:zinc finger protein 79-like [Gracilinanus agilis]